MTEGAADIRFDRRNGVTRLAQLYQRDPLRVLFPTPATGDPPVAVIVTTSGGLVAGDRLDIRVELAPGAAAHVTASAAEKIYRSTGRTTTIKQTLSIGSGATLEFLPPETILFDGARLRRETTVDLAPGSAFLGGDIMILAAVRGESASPAASCARSGNCAATATSSGATRCTSRTMSRASSIIRPVSAVRPHLRQ